ncbi:MAG: class I SAM-dependent methyltransferase [Deltaproteobacteria bacterium]|nr:class I SAM-dependent methyltransferase [Deltaproteobacteria bacterium]
MSFTYYNVRTNVDPSQEFWIHNADSVEDEVALCAYETTLEVVQAALPRQGAIVDAGCGLARWVIYLRRAGFPVIGLDLSPQPLACARRAVGALPLLASNTVHLPFRDGALAAVLSFGVIEHFEAGPQVALRELWRVLRPGGVAIVAVPYNNYFRRLLINHLRRLRDWQKRRARLPLQFAEYRFSAGELRRFLQETGFEVAAMHPDDFRLPLGKGLFADSGVFFGYRTGLYDVKPGHRHWQMNGRGRLVKTVLDRLSPWWTAGGVLAVAYARK